MLQERDYHRGEIYRPIPGPVPFDGYSHQYPVMVLQSDVGTSNAPDIIVAEIRPRQCGGDQRPTHVDLEGIEGMGPCVLCLENRRWLPKRCPLRYLGKVERMEDIEDALRYTLGMEDDAFLSVEVEAP